MPNRDALEIAVWAESVREKLSAWAGSSMPVSHAYPLVMDAELRPADKDGRVLKAQQYTQDGYLQQEITMVNPAAMDQEDVLESLVWLLLNRWVHIRQQPEERVKSPGSFPDWFAVGVAQNLYPALRVRNYRETVMREHDGIRADFGKLTRQVYMSPGRWPEKALAGLVVAWMSDSAPVSQWLPAFAEQAAAGRPIDVAFVRDTLQLPDEKTMNMQWDLWMARQNGRMIPGMYASDASGIARVISLPAEEFGVIMPSSQTITSGMLIEQRDQSWVQRYSRAISLRLRQEAAGKDPELVACVSGFIQFFDALAAPGESAKNKVKPEKWLRETWDQADTAWRTWLNRRQEQDVLLDRHAVDATNAVKEMLDGWER